MVGVSDDLANGVGGTEPKDERDAGWAPLKLFRSAAPVPVVAAPVGIAPKLAENDGGGDDVFDAMGTLLLALFCSFGILVWDVVAALNEGAAAVV